MSGDRVSVVVDDGSDPLARAVAAALRERGRDVLHVPAEELALVPLTLDGDRAWANGAEVTDVLFRAGPWAAHDAGYRSEDAGFASMEIAATWLAIIALPGVTTLNRLDALAWSSRAEWGVWRRRLLAAGVACSPLGVGDVAVNGGQWLPWGGGLARPPGRAVRRSFATALTPAAHLATSTWLLGKAVAGNATPGAATAARALADHGVRLAAIVTDERDRVVTCSARPRLDQATAQRAAPMIVEHLDADLRGRR